MPRHLTRAFAGAICCAVMAVAGNSLAIETTYGEDPVPNSRCYDGFIDLGYGIDPIPAKSPYVRWQEWRASRGLPATVGPFKRQVGESRFLSSPAAGEFVPPATSAARTSHPAPAPQASSRRNARTQNLPGRSSVW